MTHTIHELSHFFTVKANLLDQILKKNLKLAGADVATVLDPQGRGIPAKALKDGVVLWTPLPAATHCQVNSLLQD